MLFVQNKDYNKTPIPIDNSFGKKYVSSTFAEKYTFLDSCQLTMTQTLFSKDNTTKIL